MGGSCGPRCAYNQEYYLDIRTGKRFIGKREVGGVGSETLHKKTYDYLCPCCSFGNGTILQKSDQFDMGERFEEYLKGKKYHQCFYEKRGLSARIDDVFYMFSLLFGIGEMARIDLFHWCSNGLGDFLGADTITPETFCEIMFGRFLPNRIPSIIKKDHKYESRVGTKEYIFEKLNHILDILVDCAKQSRDGFPSDKDFNYWSSKLNFGVKYCSVCNKYFIPFVRETYQEAVNE